MFKEHGQQSEEAAAETASSRARPTTYQALRGKGRDGRAIGSAWYLDHDDDVADADDVSDAAIRETDTQRG